MANWKSGPNSPLGRLTPGGAETPKYPPIGAIATFRDDALGDAEFIYMPGAANVLRGSLVLIGLTPGAQGVTLAAAGVAANSGRALAVASATCDVGQYTWYQISGVAEVLAVAATVAGPAFLTATPGSIGSAVDASDQILNARIVSALGVPEANKVYLQLSRPFQQGQIT
jgi:hypothetical protein